MASHSWSMVTDREKGNQFPRRRHRWPILRVAGRREHSPQKLISRPPRQGRGFRASMHTFVFSWFSFERDDRGQGSRRVAGIALIGGGVWGEKECGGPSLKEGQRQNHLRQCIRERLF